MNDTNIIAAELNHICARIPRVENKSVWNHPEWWYLYNNLVIDDGVEDILALEELQRQLNSVLSHKRYE